MFSFCVVTILYITHHTASNASSSKNSSDSCRTLMAFTDPGVNGQPERPVPSKQTAPKPEYHIKGIVAGTNPQSLLVAVKAIEKERPGSFANTTQHGN